MKMGRGALIGGLLAATALVSPQVALAKSAAKPAMSVEARLDKLEGEVSS